ncbi:hypothetical protein OG21DRAFT_1491196 [Imleria badia]|nr:hypothetical protein OG21DRAFT_1491196 [Imleria badia]
MAYLVLISLANIDADICSKTSLHGYLLLTLLSIPNFVHKDSCTHGLLRDQLFHQALNHILTPLKTTATVGMMMSNPIGNLCYCYMPLPSWIADTLEECLIATVSLRASPVTTATSKQFGDPFPHTPRTSQSTLSAIRAACTEHAPSDYKSFLKVVKQLSLNGVVDAFWNGWPLSQPSEFITPEILHHFFQFSWDHNVKWCIAATGADELGFHFSLLQTPVGYCTFKDGVSKLK